MSCSQCQGIDEVFGEDYVGRQLRRYREKGADKTTRMLSDALASEGVSGLELLDIGGGLGAVQHDLLAAGAAHATHVEAAHAYYQAAKEEAARRGLVQKVSIRLGNFIDLAQDIDAADVVTLDRVICCYPEMERMVKLSAERARKLYGLVYPRDTWWTRLGVVVDNLWMRVRGSPYRGYVHPTREVETILIERGFVRRFFKQTAVWQITVWRYNGATT
jgi:2-polyprenyl-3-methyl-5-hydroxy-6-metoxy-1,4-benzoquinol methylase